MARRIFKYEINVTDEPTILEMPRGAKLLSVQTQQVGKYVSVEALSLWALVDDEANLPRDPRQFVVFGTGHEIPAKFEKSVTAETYIGTAQMAGGSLVWHVFEVK